MAECEKERHRAAQGMKKKKKNEKEQGLYRTFDSNSKTIQGCQRPKFKEGETNVIHIHTVKNSEYGIALLSSRSWV